MARSNLALLTNDDKRQVVIAELKQKARMRVVLRGLSSNELQAIIDRLQGLHKEVWEDEQRREREKKRVEQEARDILSQMEECGLDISALNEFQRNQETGTTEAKYIKDGVYWSGVGRRPEVFRGLSDYELEYFRIEPSNLGETSW